MTKSRSKLALLLIAGVAAAGAAGVADAPGFGAPVVPDGLGPGFAL